jgi:hypothetical protein
MVNLSKRFRILKSFIKDVLAISIYFIEIVFNIHFVLSYHMTPAVEPPFLVGEIAYAIFRAKNQAKRSRPKSGVGSNELDRRSASGI